MITAEEVTEYLSKMGVDLPDFMIDALVEQVNSIQPCLDDNYTPAIAKLIQMYVIGLMGMAQAVKYVSSQTAPSGASQSFRITDLGEKWKAQINLLRGVDVNGCANELIPDDPTTTAHGGLWVSKGGCFCK